MKNRNNFLKRLLLILSVIFPLIYTTQSNSSSDPLHLNEVPGTLFYTGPSESSTEACRDAVKMEHYARSSESGLRQGDLFSDALPFQNPNFKSKKQGSVEYLLENLPDIKPVSGLREKKKEQVKGYFLQVFEKRDMKKIRDLILEYPFLKDARFKDTSFLGAKIEPEHRKWCPEGWSPSQLSAYMRDFELLDLLLGLGSNIRTKKGQGGVSVENNPLHISIKRRFKKGVTRVLEQEGDVPLIQGERQNRLVDEQTQDKKTPWVLAVEEDVERDGYEFIEEIGRFGPSAYPESFTKNGGPMDGIEFARSTGKPGIIGRSWKFLIRFPDYGKWKEKKEVVGHRTRKPSH